MSRQRTMEAILASEYVTIGELVRLTGTRYSTLKFYTEEGFLPFRQEDRNLTRRYPREAAVRRIACLKELRSGGRTIPEIRALLASEPEDSARQIPAAVRQDAAGLPTEALTESREKL